MLLPGSEVIGSAASNFSEDSHLAHQRLLGAGKRSIGGGNLELCLYEILTRKVDCQSALPMEKVALWLAGCLLEAVDAQEMIEDCSKVSKVQDAA
jgi:hypothetical protein